MNAVAHALATALAHAVHAGSVVAKGKEGTAPHITGPNGVLVGRSSNTTSSSYVPRATSDEVVKR